MSEEAVSAGGVRPVALTAACDDQPIEFEAQARTRNLCVGLRLREARQKKGMSLAQVAAKAGLSRSFLSKAERGLAAASLSSLVQWAAALEVSVGSLFQARSPRESGRSEGLAYRGGAVLEYLLTPADERRFEVFEQYLEPGQSPDTGAWSIDADFAFIYVISGLVEFVQGEEVLQMKQGDLHVYAPAAPHRWMNASSEPTVVLVCDAPASF
jgi:transcriptional regulator with XRE-family HTH domain